MSSPGIISEIVGRIAYELTLIQPFVPTYLHLLISALFPIFTGAHASLSRPSSAAKPSKSKKRSTDNSEEEDYVAVENSQRMEGLSPSDAILYPVLTGCMLAGLYFLIKWLKDPDILNKILNWYLSVFGILSIARLLIDSTSTIMSFIFPARYSDGDMTWEVKRKQRVAIPRTEELQGRKTQERRSSPLPGSLSRLPLSPKLVNLLWTIRDIPIQPICVVNTYIRGVVEADSPVSLLGITSTASALAAVLYFNLVDKPWWLTNLLGFAFSYSALQLMSPTTFWTGTLVLTSLFFYDIYFVFFTPLMITVATKLDIPVKLLFPRPSGVDDDPTKKALSMLGLGDVVLPGIMIGLALRFDLYLFYLRKQKRQQAASEGLVKTTSDKFLALDVKFAGTEAIKAEYHPATAGWGERFWLDSKNRNHLEGSVFPKTYFYASISGYIIGMLCTLGVMHVFKHGQPALLYLVPGVLFSLWGTAFVKGDIKTMWEYTEAEEEKETPKDMNPPEISKKDENGSDLETSHVDRGKMTKNCELELKSDKAGEKAKATAKDEQRLVMFSISLPKNSTSKPSVEGLAERVKQLPSLADELLRASKDKLGDIDSTGRSGSSSESSPSRRTFDEVNGEPLGKRQRTE